MKFDGETFTHLQGSALNIGPAFTYALNRDMCVDVYYQIATVCMMTLSTAFSSEILRPGFSHNLGVGFRYKIFSAGLSTHVGKLKIYIL